MFGYLKSGIRDSAIYGFGSVAVKLSGLILIPLYTKYFSVSEYGLLGFLEATSTVIISLCGLSLFQAFFIWYWDPHYQGKQKNLFFTTLSSLVLIVILLVATGAGLSGPLSSLAFGTETYHRLLIFMISASGLQILINIPAKLLQLQQKSMLYTAATLLMLFINLFFTIIFIIHFKLGIEAIYMAQTIGGLSYLLFLSPFMFRNISFHFERKAFMDMIVFVLPLIILSLASLVISLSDRYILRYVSGYEKLGLYSFGAKLANTVYVLLVGPIQLAIYPILVKIFNTDPKQRFYSKVLTYLGFVVLFCILGFSFFSQEIVKILARNVDYWESYRIIPIIAFASVFMLMKDIASLHLQLLKKTKVLSIIIVSVSFLNIFLNITLIPLWGYIGAAVSFLLSQVIYFAILHYFANRKYKIGYEYRKIVLMISISILLSVLAFSLAQTQLVIRLILKVILLGFFPVSLYYFNFFEEIELRRLSDIWRDWKNPGKWMENLRRFVKD